MSTEGNAALQKVGECLYRNAHSVYFGWFAIKGKQIKRSLKTTDKELARRRLADLRKKWPKNRGEPQQSLKDYLVRQA